MTNPAKKVSRYMFVPELLKIKLEQGFGRSYPCNWKLPRLTVCHFTAQNMNFSLRIPSVNVTESAGNNRDGHIY